MLLLSRDSYFHNNGQEMVCKYMTVDPYNKRDSLY